MFCYELYMYDLTSHWLFTMFCVAENCLCIVPTAFRLPEHLVSVNTFEWNKTQSINKFINLKKIKINNKIISRKKRRTGRNLEMMSRSKVNGHWVSWFMAKKSVLKGSGHTVQWVMVKDCWVQRSLCQFLPKPCTFLLLLGIWRWSSMFGAHQGDGTVNGLWIIAL